MDVRPLKCNCCRRETLASIEDGVLIIRTERHGQTHVLALPLRDGRIEEGDLTKPMFAVTLGKVR